MKFNIDFRKQVLPHLLAIAGILVILGIYFHPVLEGREMQQHDIVMAKSMQQEIQTYLKETGELSLWTNSIFGGMPSYQIWVKYPNNIATYLIYYIRLGLPEPISYVFLYFICFYLFMLVLRVKPELAFIGAVAFAFSSYNFINIEAGHLTKALAVAFIPLVLSGVMLTLRGKLISGFLLTAFGMALEIKSNHFQITYYLAIILLILFIVEFIKVVKDKSYLQFVRAGVILVIAAGLGIMVNITNILVTREYVKYTMRGGSELSHKEQKGKGLEKDYALSWSYGVGESFTLAIPFFRGGASAQELGTGSKVYKAMMEQGVDRNTAKKYLKQMPMYWGSMGSTSGPIYIGASIIFLFIIGMFVVKDRLKWWLFASAILCLMLAWGKNFLPLTNLFYDYFPMYNKFRVPMTLLLIVGFVVPVLSVLAVNEILSGKVSKDEVMKALKYTLYGFGGLMVLFVLFGSALYSFIAESDSMYEKDTPWLVEALRDERARLLRLDALRALFFILAVASVIWAFLKNKIKLNLVYIILGLIVLVDLWAVDQRYLNKDDFKRKKKSNRELVQPTEADLAILADKDPNYRVLNLNVSPWNDATTSYFHKSIGGYHGAKMARYQDLIDQHLTGEIQALIDSLKSKGLFLANTPVLNMLNAKYIMVSQEASGALRNPYALGNVWFVKEYKLVDNADKELNALSTIDPAVTALIDRHFADEVKAFTIVTDSAASIRLTDYKPNKLTYESNSGSEQLAVFSEIYYPNGWKVTIDGKEASHFRADYVLRAMRVPAGKHTIVFSFEPKAYYTGEKISLAGSIILILLLAGGIFVSLKPKKEVSA